MFFRNQVWLDGLFMVQPFYAQWTQRFDPDNQTAWDDIINHFDLIETHARHEPSNLFVHGWVDGDAVWADPATGKSPNVWGRAVGWYFMALLEVLSFFPQQHEGYYRLESYYTQLADALAQARDPETGSWWQVMEDPYAGAEGNFVESSASAMFSWGILAGVRVGILGREYVEDSVGAYEGLVRNFVVEEEDGGRLTYNTTSAEAGLSAAVDYEVGWVLPLIDKGGC